MSKVWWLVCLGFASLGCVLVISGGVAHDLGYVNTAGGFFASGVVWFLIAVFSAILNWKSE